MQNHLFPFIKFWLKYPALLYGLSSLLGFYTAFTFSPLLIIPFASLWIPPLILRTQQIEFNYKPFILGLFLFISSIVYGIMLHPSPSLPPEGVRGRGYLTIDSLSTQSTYFGQRWIYRCRLFHFFPQDLSKPPLHHVKCQVTFPRKKSLTRPLADRSYFVEGVLIQTDKGSYIFKVANRTLWHPIAKTWSLAEWRYQLKTGVKNWMKKRFSHPENASFLAGLVTGEFDDLHLRAQFARFGLQHILAISGFHFAIIAGVIYLVLRFCVPQNWAIGITIVMLAGYLLFLGGQPSIVRAWMMALIILFGGYIERTAKGLNSLGVALMATLLYDPQQCQEWGFQFSFLVTGAILCFYSSLDASLLVLLPKRPLHQMIEMSIWNQSGYCLLALFRQSLALTLSVSLVAFPLTLYYFHSFPWMSLLYNLFFPLLVSVSLFLLIVGLMAHPLPFVGGTIHYFNNHYTYWLLSLVYDIPSSIDRYYRVEEVDAGHLIFYFSFLFLASIWLRAYFANKTEQWPEWGWI